MLIQFSKDLLEGLQAKCGKFGKEVTHACGCMKQEEKEVASGWQGWEGFVTEVMYEMSLRSMTDWSTLAPSTVLGPWEFINEQKILAL